jgi:VanZ family protein
MSKAIAKRNTVEIPTGAIGRWWKREYRFIEELALLASMALIIIGIAITNISPATSYRYWLAVMGLFALAGLVLGGVRSRQNGHSIMHVAIDQLVHWGATFGAVLAVFIMLKAGRLTYEATGLVILLLLGLAMFLDGYYRVGWRFALLGVLVIALALAAAYLSAYIWPILITGAIIWPLSIMFEIYLTHRRDRKNRSEPLPD